MSEKTVVHKQEYGLSLKTDFLQISIIVFTSRKKLGTKKIPFSADKNLVSTSRK